MKHLTAYSFTMLQCYHSANLSYTCRLVIIFPEYSQTSCNSVGIIPAKYMNCILVLIIKILYLHSCSVAKISNLVFNLIDIHVLTFYLLYLFKLKPSRFAISRSCSLEASSASHISRNPNPLEKTVLCTAYSSTKSLRSLSKS